MSLKIQRKGEYGNRVIVAGNLYSVSIKTTGLDAVRLTPQQARDIAHALLRAAKDVDDV